MNLYSFPDSSRAGQQQETKEGPEERDQTTGEQVPGDRAETDRLEEEQQREHHVRGNQVLWGLSR